jgi:hypothetical protein
MKTKFLLSLLTIAIAFSSFVSCGTLANNTCNNPPCSGTRLYYINGDYITSYSTGERLYYINGDYIISYSTGERLYYINGDYITSYSTGERLYYINGDYITKY